MSRSRYEDSQRYRPIRPWGYVGYRLLYCIPVIGWIFFLVFTFHRGNINRRNYTRSLWCWFLLGLILTLLMVIGLMIALHITPSDAANGFVNFRTETAKKLQEEYNIDINEAIPGFVPATAAEVDEIVTSEPTEEAEPAAEAAGETWTARTESAADGNVSLPAIADEGAPETAQEGAEG